MGEKEEGGEAERGGGGGEGEEGEEGKEKRKKKQLRILWQCHPTPVSCGEKALMGISRSGSNRPSGQLCSHLPT